MGIIWSLGLIVVTLLALNHMAGGVQDSRRLNPACQRHRRKKRPRADLARPRRVGSNGFQFCLVRSS